MASVPATYKAYEYSNHSQDVLKEVKLNASATPAPLGPTEVTVKVFSTSVNPIDWKLIPFGVVFGLLPNPATPEHPLRIGSDLSGVVVAVGSNVTNFKIGDAVYGSANFEKFGSFAEYFNVDTKYIAHKPAKLSFNEAAGISLVGQTSHQAIVDHGKLQAGQRVLILGGSTATGIYAIQQAKAIGAYVIATSGSRNVDLIKSLGAEQVIDYTKDKWNEVLEAGSIDLIYDCGVEADSWNDAAQKVLKPKTGKFVTIGHPQNPIESPIGASIYELHTQLGAKTLSEITKLVEEGKSKVLIDSVYPFDQTHKAIERLMTGHATGKVIIEIAKE